MFRYILKRILIFIPTIIAISLITFVINVNSPGDPVENMFGSGDDQNSNSVKTEENYLAQVHALKLDLPVFYFSLATMAESDTLFRIPKKAHREILSELTSTYGNWPQIESYYHSIKKMDRLAYAIKRDSTNGNALIQIKQNVRNLYDYSEAARINFFFEQIKLGLDKLPNHQELKNSFTLLEKSHQQILSEQSTWKNLIPSFSWFGWNNQYHHWMTSFMTGDFGTSYSDKRPIKDTMYEKIGYTMLISFLSILLSYGIAIPLGVMSGVKKGKLYDNTVSTVLFVLYSLPTFWIATILIVFVGGELDWLPTHGIGEVPDNATFFEWLSIRAEHMVLPLFCWTYGSLAYLSRQMRGGIINVLNMDFIRTARAKGLSENQVVWKHAFRNSLLPVITIFASVFPLMIGGSVVLEVIFSLPGLGQYGYQAILFKDFPVILAVMMFSAILTMTGYLISDILYAFVDPRITYDK